IAQRRRSSTVKTTTTSPPMIPSRSARRGVRRYGSSTRGSAGRNRSVSERLAKQANLLHGGARLRLPQQTADERVDRDGEHEVDDHRRDERDQQHFAAWCRLAEDEVEDQ